MASVLAIVSRAVFDEDHAGAAIGDVLAIDRYVSKLPVFKKVADKGDAVFLVTVRPGNVLWRVAVVEGPVKKKGKAWVGKKNTTPIADASSAVDSLQFESGHGVGPAKGALGMALQTPRRLTATDVALLRVLGKPLPAAAWPLLVGATRDEYAASKNIDAIVALLDGPAIVDLLVELCATNDPYDVFDARAESEMSESVAADHAEVVLLTLGALLARAGVVEAFAKRTDAELAKGKLKGVAARRLAAIASAGSRGKK